MTDAEKIAVLRRRHDYLTAKLAAGDYSENAAKWAEAEAAALKWAIKLLRDEIPRGLRMRHDRDLFVTARSAVRLARDHPDMPNDEVAMAALPDDARHPIRTMT